MKSLFYIFLGTRLVDGCEGCSGTLSRDTRRQRGAEEGRGQELEKALGGFRWHWSLGFNGRVMQTFHCAAASPQQSQKVPQVGRGLRESRQHLTNGFLVGG